jgi:hypothetical protein
MVSLVPGNIGKVLLERIRVRLIAMWHPNQKIARCEVSGVSAAGWPLMTFPDFVIAGAMWFNRPP